MQQYIRRKKWKNEKTESTLPTHHLLSSKRNLLRKHIHTEVGAFETTLWNKHMKNIATWIDILYKNVLSHAISYIRVKLLAIL